jgi:hypothetical protein
MELASTCSQQNGDMFYNSAVTESSSSSSVATGIPPGRTCSNIFNTSSAGRQQRYININRFSGKAPGSSSTVADTLEAAALAAAAAAIVTSRSTNSASAATCGITCNPHGIDHILKRREDMALSSPATCMADSISSLCDGGGNANTDFNLDSANASSLVANNQENSAVNVVSSAAQAFTFPMTAELAEAVAADTDLQSPTSCWPGIQGLIANPTLWRDRVYLPGELTVLLTTFSFPSK